MFFSTSPADAIAVSLASARFRDEGGSYQNQACSYKGAQREDGVSLCSRCTFGVALAHTHRPMPVCRLAPKKKCLNLPRGRRMVFYVYLLFSINVARVAVSCSHLHLILFSPAFPSHSSHFPLSPPPVTTTSCLSSIAFISVCVFVAV